MWQIDSKVHPNIARETLEKTGNAAFLAQTCNPAATEQLHWNVPQACQIQYMSQTRTHYLQLFSMMFLIVNVITVCCNKPKTQKSFFTLKGILSCSLSLLSKISSSSHNHCFSPCQHLLPGLLEEPLCGSPCFQSSSLTITVVRVSLQICNSESWFRMPQCLYFARRAKYKIPEWLKNLYDTHLLFPASLHSTLFSLSFQTLAILGISVPLNLLFSLLRHCSPHRGELICIFHVSV